MTVDGNFKETSYCVTCKEIIHPRAPMGLCPVCLMETATEEETPSSGGFRLIVPTADRLQAEFAELDITRILGKGGMSVVYLARQRHLDRPVALKVLPKDGVRDPDLIDRFGREALLLSRLNHPHIVTIYDFGETDSFLYLVMEYVEGPSLREYISRKTIAAKESARILLDLSKALEYAHNQGILHRDIKPENVLLSRQAGVKLADFGLAEFSPSYPEDGLHLTITGEVLGTVHYMAPELIDAGQSPDERSDIYSLGVVFYEMLTGRLPLGRFESPSKSQDLDPAFDRIIDRMLARDPEERYQSVSELRRELEVVTSTWKRHLFAALGRKEQLLTGWDPNHLSDTQKSWLACEFVHFFRLAFLWPAFLIVVFGIPIFDVRFPVSSLLAFGPYLLFQMVRVGRWRRRHRR